MEDGKLIGSFDTKRGHDQVRVYELNGGGKTCISVRMFHYRGEDWHLRKTGVTIPRNKGYKLTKLIEKALDRVSEEKLQTATTK